MRAACSSAGRQLRERKLHDERRPPQQRRIERRRPVAGQDREAPEGLHLLQKKADLDVGVAVVAILDFTALAEECVGFVEQQYGATLFRRLEHASQVLLGLADVFATSEERSIR